MKSEPAIIIGAVEAVALAAIGLVAVLLEWDAELTAAVVAVVGPVLALVAAVLTRSRVTPVP